VSALMVGVSIVVGLLGVAAVGWTRRSLGVEHEMPEHVGADEYWSPTEEVAAVEPADWDLQGQEELARDELQHDLDAFEANMRQVINKAFAPHLERT
jgi:hypothetical protein